MGEQGHEQPGQERGNEPRREDVCGSEGSGAADHSCADSHAPSAAGGCNGHGGCGSGGGCGGHEPVVPELDARTIHPEIRQSAIFGVLVGLPPEAAVTIVAPNDPSPIVAMLQERLPGEYAVTTTQGAAQEWRATFVRRAA